MIIVVILLALAVMDLVVGVSNDAVNFLNSAIGSRVASYRTIIIVAIVGIVIGALFSSGIMEVARKGIFHPDLFTFDKILVVFLAVMLTDVLLLDLFNTMGLPTSTTVSIVFEILGAAFVTGILFTMDKGGNINNIFDFINFKSTQKIISGIFLSILIAFTSGALVQYLVRMMFSFQIEKNIKRYGSLFAGVGLTTIVYFLLIKGLKSTTIIPADIKESIDANIWMVLLGIFAATTIISLILQKSLNINPLKVVVLAGTFSLAMAFAGNDLVNFIGVPITALLAYQNWTVSGVPAGELYQTFLAGNQVVVPNYMLIIAGVIMGLTIWLSAKAKKVTETEVGLSNQNEGMEHFKANRVSRRIVSTSATFGKMLSAFIPGELRRKYNISFQKSKMQSAVALDKSPAFDLVRASINLVLASALIAFATSLKLPLSTTYVSFMVAMGTSLADKAWGSESAVYRVAGVMSVIGGWFLTALIAFAGAGILATILYFSSAVMTLVVVALVGVYLFFSHVAFARKDKNKKSKESKLSILDDEDLTLLEKNRTLVANLLRDVKVSFEKAIVGLLNHDIKSLEEANATAVELEDQGLTIRNKSIKYIRTQNADDRSLSQLMLYSSDLIADLVQSLKLLTDETLMFVKNLHQDPDDRFMVEVYELKNNMVEFMDMYIQNISNEEKYKFSELKEKRNQIRSYVESKLDSEITAIHGNDISIKQGILQTTIYLQCRDIQAVMMRIVKMYHKYDKSLVLPE